MRFYLSKFLFLILLLFGSACYAQSSDSSGEMDKARVFPVQRKATVIHSPNKEVTDPNAESLAAMSDKQKILSKDTSLVINGNGGSTNRPAGGNATLRKRFTF
jgi:hypothetical protein